MPNQKVESSNLQERQALAKRLKSKNGFLKNTSISWDS